MRKSNFQKLIIVINIITIIIFLFWRFKVGIWHRFDIDEFAHLHWAYNFYTGVRPYTDFLPPLFLFALSPLFIIFGKTLAVLVAGRVFAFIVFLLLNLALFFLVKRVRDLHTAVFSLFIFNFLPLPGEKIIEIRPDTLAILFAFLGIFFLVRGICLLVGKNFFLSGLFYGLAAVTLTKTVFFLPAPFFVFLIWGLRSGKQTFLKEKIMPFLAGIAIPAVFTLLFFFLSGNFSRAFFLNTKFINRANVILGEKFPMLPNLFFYPNDYFYGEWGVNPTLVLNLVIYILGAFWGIVRLVSFLDKKEKKDQLIELLLAVSFLTNLLAYIKFYPLKHVQYFIAFSPLVAFYFADFLMRLKMRWGMTTRLVFLLFLFFVFARGVRMYQIKSSWTNRQTFEDLEKVQKTIPANEYVFDLYGASLFYRDPYYICCLSYGEFWEAFTFPIVSLPESLKATQTKYVFPYHETRLTRLPLPDERFVRDNYVMIETNPTIMVAGKVRKIKASEEQSVDLIASGKYKIFFEGKELGGDDIGAFITIDSQEVEISPVQLTAGEHRLKSARSGELKMVYTN